MPVARGVRVFPIGGVRFVSFGGARASRRSDIAAPLSSSPIQLVSTGRGVAFAANRSAICRFKGRGAPFAIFDADADADIERLDAYEHVERGSDDYDELWHDVMDETSSDGTEWVWDEATEDAWV